MTGFQKGDYIFNYNGRVIYLRLTLGALAEIFARLELDDIKAVSARIRKAKRADIINIFSALSRPAHTDDINFDNLNLQKAMPVLADIFETAFAPMAEAAQ